MNLSTKLDHFRAENPYDIATQAKRLLATDDKEMINYVVELGLTLARSRQRHDERQYIKDTGTARPKEHMVVAQGRVTGAVKFIPGKRGRNAMTQLIADTWRVNGEQRLGDATHADLGSAIKRESTSLLGHRKNIDFYQELSEPLKGTTDSVRTKWSEGSIRTAIEKVYGEFRTTEAA